MRDYQSNADRSAERACDEAFVCSSCGQQYPRIHRNVYEDGTEICESCDLVVDDAGEDDESDDRRPD
jgi:hypothetical protein